MKKDGTAGKGRALLRHLAVVLVFVLAAALVFTPIWVPSCPGQTAICS